MYQTAVCYICLWPLHFFFSKVSNLLLPWVYFAWICVFETKWCVVFQRLSVIFMQMKLYLLHIAWCFHTAHILFIHCTKKKKIASITVTRYFQIGTYSVIHLILCIAWNASCMLTVNVEKYLSPNGNVIDALESRYWL